MVKKYFKNKSNITAQIAEIKKLYPSFRYAIRGNDIIFKGEIQVKPEFPVYTISLKYNSTNKHPIVKILNPKLVENPPHFYSKTKSLCLYHPKNFYWDNNKLIANEIMDWTIAWIYFYEVWLETKIWYGPEVTHSNDKK